MATEDSTATDKLVVSPDLLWDLGYRRLTRSQVSDLLADLYDTLELRVGTRLAEGLDSNELARFERAVSDNDDRKALAWLTQTIPNYRDIVTSEYDYIVGTLRNASRLSQPGRKDGRMNADSEIASESD